MKIKELIGKLQMLDPDLEVLVEGYEAHYDSPVISEICEFDPNVHEEWYYGSHEKKEGGSMKGIVLKKPQK